MPIIRYPRGEIHLVSPHFTVHEFECHCGQCPFTDVDSELAQKLECLRQDAGRALTLRSGFRCQAYQDQLSNSGLETARGISQHTLGRAADVSDGVHSGLELSLLAAKAGFLAIGIAQTWIHVDLRGLDPTKADFGKERRWSYLKR